MGLHRQRPRYLRGYIAIPQDHGSWVFLFSPLLVGLFLAGFRFPATIFVVLGSLAGFLLRQPVSIIVRIKTGRRSSRDLFPAIVWSLFYALVGVSQLIGLLLSGFSNLVFLILPGFAVFAWHLILVSHRDERKQMGVEIVGSGVLALSAPAAYWVGVGGYSVLGWWLWGLLWLQSAASIVFAYLRLTQRKWTQVPDLAARWIASRRAMLYTTFNLITVYGFGRLGFLPGLLFIPYLIQWGETIIATLRPAVGVQPKHIGYRQLASSLLFTVLFILVWGFNPL